MGKMATHGALALAAELGVVPVGAENPVPVSAGSLSPLGYQQITNLAAAVQLTVPDGATMALIQAEAQSVRWRDDGTLPTASVGMSLAAGDVFEYNGDLAAIRLIQTAASAKLNVSYYG